MILGLLPQSHSFALVLLGHTSVYQGDGVVVYQGFDLLQILKGIAQFRISVLCLVSAQLRKEQDYFLRTFRVKNVQT